MSRDLRAEGLAAIKAGALAKDNPLATKDQRDVEKLAIRLSLTLPVRKAKHEAALHWLSKARPETSEEAMQSFDAAVSEFVFHGCLNAANSDANYPKVVKVEGEPHSWFGMDVPGARRGGNNADNAYRIISVNGTDRFVVVGKLPENPPSDITLTLIANTAMSKTVRTLEFRDVEVDDEGVFVLTIDPDPADGRKNHMQSTPDTKYVFVRDSLTDWHRQRVSQLVCLRLDPPSAPPVDFDELVRRAAQYAADDMAYYWDMCMGQSYNFPVNTVPKVRNAGPYGGLVSQSGSTGHYNIADDEALVVTITQGGAPYVSFMVHDPWWVTRPFADHTASLNLAQVARNADGSITFVVAVRDPGVHNWIDTAGVHAGIFYFRWQGLPRDGSGEPEIVGHSVVKLKDLRSALPEETKFVTPDERALQIKARQKAVGGWWSDK